MTISTNLDHEIWLCDEWNRDNTIALEIDERDSGQAWESGWIGTRLTRDEIVQIHAHLTHLLSLPTPL
jgi:hypothetical protein